MVFSLKGGGKTSSTHSDSTLQVTLAPILLNLTGVPFDFLENDIRKSIHPKNYVESGHYRSKIRPIAIRKAR